MLTLVLQNVMFNHRLEIFGYICHQVIADADVGFTKCYVQS